MITLPRRYRLNQFVEGRDRIGLFLALLSLVFLAAGCGGEAPVAGPGIPTVANVALAPTNAPATATRSASPTAAPTLAPTKTPLPTATRPMLPTIQPTPCAYAILPALQPAYLDIELGCPLNPGRDPIATAYAPFVGGQMLWREDNAVIYVLTNDGRWAQYDDLWREGDAEFTCGEPNNPPTPVRGFGRVWCDQTAVRQQLGAATAAEIGDAGGRAQDFVNGMILAAPDGSLFVLVGEAATWRRVWPND